MSYLRRTNGRRQTSWWTFAVASFCLVLVVFINFIKPQTLSVPLFKVVSPLWKTEQMFGDWMYSSLSYFEFKYKLFNENRKLSQEVASLRGKLLSMESAQKENDSMKKLLSRNLAKKAVFGVVLSAPPFSPYDTLVIDVGTDEGVKQGDLVITDDNVAIGDLTEVYSSYSRATLFSSPSREVPVLIGQNKIEALARGVGGGSFEIILPREVQVKEGDSVVLPNINSLVYAYIYSIQTSDVDFLQLVTFTSPVNIYELRYVGIIPSLNSTDQNDTKNN